MSRKKVLSYPRISFTLVSIIFLILGAGIFWITAKKLTFDTGCCTKNFSGEFDKNEKLAIFEGKEIKVPLDYQVERIVSVLGLENMDNRWIEVDLSEQKIRAWEGSNLYLESLVSTGKDWTPTPKGEFRIWTKIRSTKMEGGQGKGYYYLPNVPYIMYFSNDKVPSWKGYGLHGTYWHNNFGHKMSHGCVNLPTPVAEKLYYWVGPVLPDGKKSINSSDTNPGTRIVIHD